MDTPLTKKKLYDINYSEMPYNIICNKRFRIYLNEYIRNGGLDVTSITFTGQGKEYLVKSKAMT